MCMCGYLCINISHQSIYLYIYLSIIYLSLHLSLCGYLVNEVLKEGALCVVDVSDELVRVQDLLSTHRGHHSQRKHLLHTGFMSSSVSGHMSGHMSGGI